MSSSASEVSPEVTYNLLQTEALQFLMDAFTAFALSGEDRKGWLQGQITQDLRDLPSRGHQTACLCSPTGQLTAIVDIFDADDYLIIITNQPTVIQERVDNFVIMEEVELSTISTGFTSIQGIGATKYLSEFFNLPPVDVYRDEETILVRNNRSGTGGWDILKSSRKDWQVQMGSQQGLNLAGLESGFPIFGVDTDSKTLPPELGKIFEKKTISYKKGCYQGQEVLQRMHTRGHTNKTWVGLLCDGSVDPGQKISIGTEVLGTVTRSGTTTKNGNIAAGYVKNKASREGTMVEINGIPAEVIEMPF